jgi:3-deoxy-D-manno-octulosonic-acid transferase
MRMERALYNAMLPLASAWARILALFNGKIAEGIRGRKGIRERWIEKAAALPRDKATVWFHVSSVGEFLQARPVIDLLSDRYGESIQIALTFFSPSGINYLEKHDYSAGNAAVGFVDYLPLDTPANARFCISTLDPSMIVYVKFDLWPNLIIEAHKSGISQLLVSGTLSPGSKRLTGPARKFYAALYSKLDAIAAISEEDAERFKLHMKGNTEIVPAGDTRFDQVCERIDSSRVEIPGAILRDERDFIIAGSTWPKDEALVVPAFAELTSSLPDTAMIIAPHEPTEKRLAEIEGNLKRHGIESIRLSGIGDAPVTVPVIIADGVGYLAELYRAGTLAYVGGSWTTGVHNVMEPAVLGLPVFFGPRIDNSWEAGKLVELGTGRIVRQPGELAEAVAEILRDPDLLRQLGERGAGFIRGSCGAAARCLDLIEKHANFRKATDE